MEIHKYTQAWQDGLALAQAVLEGQITLQDILQILGSNISEALIGDIRYIIEHAEQFKPDAVLTEEQAEELGYRLIGAIWQLEKIGYTIYSLTIAIKQFVGAKMAGPAQAVKYFDDIQLKTPPNKAYFWSGMGEDGAEIAANIAKKNGGVTLETTIKAQGIKLPEWDFDNPYAIQAWKDASIAYAKQASGEVNAIIGHNLSRNGIWNTVELPSLKANPNVTKIILIDPKTLVKTIIFTR